MVKREELYEQGWHVSPNGYDLISENTNLHNKNAILANVLNTDIREFGEAVLNAEIKQSKTGKVVLQIQKIKNVSAPKNKENSQAAPRMLKLTLTDGHTSCQAVEISNINSLSRSDTPPGSKILINGAKVSANCILLRPNCCTLLGGRVPALYDKWELTKNVSEQVRPSGGIDGPPPWVNFGEKVITSLTKEPFKSLVTKEIKQDEFDIQRQDAINVATTGAVKKVFGGGSKTVPLVGNRKSYNYENRRNRRDFKEKGLEEHQKAPDKVSLFNFLEDKLQGDNSHRDNDAQFKSTSVRDEPPKARFPQRKENYNFNNIDSVSKHFDRLSLDKSLNPHSNFHHKNSSPGSTYKWKVGDLCMAKYWEDSKYYNATIINLTERTCVVKFNEYGNVEEVLKLDCIPISLDSTPTYQSTRNYYKGSSNYHHKKTYSNN